MAEVEWKMMHERSHVRFAICDLRFFNVVIVQFCYSAFYNLPIVNLQFIYNLPLMLRMFKQFRKLLFDNMVMNKFANFNLEFSKNVNVWWGGHSSKRTFVEADICQSELSLKQTFVEADIRQSRHSSKQTFVKADIHGSRHSSKQTFVEADIHQSRHSSKQTFVKADIRRRGHLSKQTFVKADICRSRHSSKRKFVNSKQNCPQNWLINDM